MIFRRIKRNFRILVIFSLVIVIVTLYLLRPLSPGQDSNNAFTHSRVRVDQLLINTTSCKIVQLDPFDKSMAKYFQNVPDPFTCSQRIVTVQGRVVTMSTELSAGVECCYRKFQRITQDPDNYDWHADGAIKLSEDCHTLLPGTPTLINDSFIRVECVHQSRWLWSTTKSDYFAFVQPPELLPGHVQKKVERWGKEKFLKGENYAPPPSILIFGLDSTSRLHLSRALPRTRRFLLENDFIEQLGYTKVGLNTLPNMMALLTGQKMYDNGTFACMPESGIKFDDCPFLWKNFSDHGYLTTFIEDIDTVGTYDYLNVGFVEQPTDYYTHPMRTIVKQLGNGLPNEPYQCIHGGRNDTSFVVQYVLDVLALSKARGIPSFTMAWLVGPTHDDMNMLNNDDFHFRNFFHSILTNSAYDPDNTVLFFIGDHGYHMGEFRETFHGFHEDNLPMLLVRLPPSLKSQFPHWSDNLRMNSKRLSSTYDFRETLKDLLALSASEDAPDPLPDVHGPGGSFHSLLSSQIPEDRTCADAGIKSQDCMCGVSGALELELDEVGNDKLTKFSKLVLQHINNHILREVIDSGICEKLSWRSNLYGRTYSAAAAVAGQNDKSRTYLIGVEARPSRGTFEAYIREYDNGTVVVEGEIYRMNRYRGQSDCVTSTLLERYCYCTNLRSLINWFW